jgi:hypothetical protein
MTNGNRGGHEQASGDTAPHESSASEPREPRESQLREPRESQPREQRNEQAPLDLPPPPPAKPFVVWSSAPSDAPPEGRRDE